MFNINNKNLISLSLGILTIFSFTYVLKPNNANADDCMGNPGWYHSICSNYQNSYNNNNYGYGYDNNGNINPVPSISSVNPNSGRINTATTITVQGYGFVPGSIIKWNSENRPTTYIDSGTLQAQLYSSDLSTSGNYLITVSNLLPGGGISNAILFTINNNSTAINTSSSTSKTSSTSSTKNSTSNTSTNTNDMKVQPSPSEVKNLAAGAIFGSNAFLPSSIFQWIAFFILILLAIVLWRKLYVSEEDHHKPLKHS